VCCVEAVTGLLAQHRLNCRFACATPFKGIEAELKRNGASHPVSDDIRSSGLFAIVDLASEACDAAVDEHADVVFGPI